MAFNVTSTGKMVQQRCVVCYNIHLIFEIWFAFSGPG
jgi:hypothetical protein